MQISIYPNYDTLCRNTADLITVAIAKKPKALVCLASGHTPLGVFKCLVEDARNGRVDLRGCRFVGLDEWVGMGADHDGSCRQMMDEFFFKPANIPAANIEFFNGLADDLQAEATRINTLIEQHGGLDVMLVGVGTNGHIAMNEPGTPFDITAHVSQLAEETKAVGQKYFKETTPLSHGITLGLYHFSHAALPILMANGIKKAEALRKATAEPVTEQLPASILQTIDHSRVMVDEEAGQYLKES